MSRTRSALARILAGRRALPLPRWLNRALSHPGDAARRIDPARMTDAQLAALGLDRDDLIAALRDDWNPPSYWLRQPCTCRGLS